jgi:hypothetical protein
MKIMIPLLPIEFEITVRRRTEPIRFRVRTLMIAVGLVAFVVYLLLPLSEADRQLMARYEQLGPFTIDYSKDLTRAEINSMIGPPTRVDVRPNTCPDYIWVARFETALSFQEFELGLSIDSNTDTVTASGLNKTEYQGLQLICFRIEQLMRRIGLSRA